MTTGFPQISVNGYPISTRNKISERKKFDLSSRILPAFYFPVFCLLSSVFYFDAYAQTSKSTNILFVLDASGSMNGKWKGVSKFELAKDILVKTVDSSGRSNPNVQFALRVFGHQSPRSANNCRDSKLEVPFSRGNLSSIGQRLNSITPQGQTPVAYALREALRDFPDTTARNAIILITDGNETCDGNLCELAVLMEQRNIALRPFIVGLGLNDSLKKKFDCLGNFYDVQNEDMLSSTMRAVITRVLNPTTSQINLLDSYGKPSVTNLELTLYDRGTGMVKYQFLHTLNAKGFPDTLSLDPKFTYDITVHSVPSVTKQNVSLITGTHNIIAVEVPLGSLEIKVESTPGTFSSLPCIVRKAGEKEILFVQDANTVHRYFAGEYDVQVLTLPVTDYRVFISDAKTFSVKVPRSGILMLTPAEAGVASVFLEKQNGLEKVYDFYTIRQQQTLHLQPGDYKVVYRSDKVKQAERSKEFSVKISSGKTTSIRL